LRAEFKREHNEESEEKSTATRAIPIVACDLASFACCALCCRWPCCAPWAQPSPSRFPLKAVSVCVVCVVCVCRVCVSNARGCVLHPTPFPPLPGWRQNEDSFYLLVSRRLPFWVAERFCNDFVFQGVKAHLASVTSERENQFVASLSSPGSPRWIGAFRNSGEDMWRWTDDAAWSDHKLWFPGEPNRFVGANGVVESCVQQGHSTMRGAFWNDADCLRTQDFICEFDATTFTRVSTTSTTSSTTTTTTSGTTTSTEPGSTTTTTTTTSTTTTSSSSSTTTSTEPEVQCIEGWHAFQGCCYRTYDQKLSQPAAEKFCQTFQGHLATIRSVDENTFISTIVKPGNVYARWIGVLQRPNSNLWVNLDGSLAEFVKWYPGEPNNRSPSQRSSENCVAQGHSSFPYADGWNDSTCTTPRAFVCKVCRK
jgi:hypothetical protein